MANNNDLMPVTLRPQPDRRRTERKYFAEPIQGTLTLRAAEPVVEVTGGAVFTIPLVAGGPLDARPRVIVTDPQGVEAVPRPPQDKGTVVVGEAHDQLLRSLDDLLVAIRAHIEAREAIRRDRK